VLLLAHQAPVYRRRRNLGHLHPQPSFGQVRDLLRAGLVASASASTPAILESALEKVYTGIQVRPRTFHGHVGDLFADINAGASVS